MERPTPPTTDAEFKTCCAEQRLSAQCNEALCTHDMTAERLLTEGSMCMDHIDGWLKCGVGRLSID